MLGADVDLSREEMGGFLFQVPTECTDSSNTTFSMFLLLHSRVVPSPDLDLTFSSLVLLTIILACFTGNIALLVGLISRRYEISLIAGIVALAVITRIGVPKWVEYGLMPGVGSLCLALSFWLYLTLGGTADANRG